MGHPDAVGLRVREIAEAQHGVIARRQLLAAGMGRERIRSWRGGGRLVDQRRGVYSLGHGLLTVEGRWMAAVLACREGAALSHRSAAGLWGLRSAGAPAIEVTVGANGPRSPGGDIAVTRSRLVVPGFATTYRGVPVTTVAWTLLDLGAVLRPHQLRRAVEQAERLELFDLRAVGAALAADPGRPGSPALRALLEDARTFGITMTRSEVEAAMLQLCVDHGLPRPQVNHYENGVEVDFRWSASRLIVEVDGWAWHRSRAAFVRDRERDRRLLRAGWRTARFIARDVQRDPGAVAAELALILDVGGR
jgi:very-short-patch-repair endonuclease